MAKPSRIIKNPFVASSPPSPFFCFSPLASHLLFFSTKKASPRSIHHAVPPPPIQCFFFSLVISSLIFSGISFLAFNAHSPEDSTMYSSISLSSSSSSSSSSISMSNSASRHLFASLSVKDRSGNADNPNGVMVPLPAREGYFGNLTEEEAEFWKQPDGEGFKPCLRFSIAYRRKSVRVSKEKRRFLVVVASGGLNQQRNQIIDAVVIARILEAALVVPVLQVNRIWGDESEFSEIFDVEHFKRTLRADVRIVSSLPSTHLMSRQTIENQIPYDVSPFWIRARFFKQLNEEGLLVLKGLHSKLAKNLPQDLQKLRCKVAFHALRFAAAIETLGNKLARRMWIEGPYIALHLRLEKDVWVRTGCLTGLGYAHDRAIAMARAAQPEYLTGKLNMSYMQRRLAGLCPLNALEMARLLKALGAPSNAAVYIAGGDPFGGSRALQPLAKMYPNLVTKEMLAHKGELTPYANKSSALAAIDYIVSLSSDVFIPSHGGNMGRAMQGHRAYVGHRKFIKPNKRVFLPLLEDSSISDAELKRIIRKLHSKSQGQPEPRSNKSGGDRDVVAYPVSDCMCNKKHRSAIF